MGETLERSWGAEEVVRQEVRSDHTAFLGQRASLSLLNPSCVLGSGPH